MLAPRCQGKSYAANKHIMPGVFYALFGKILHDILHIREKEALCSSQVGTNRGCDVWFVNGWRSWPPSSAHHPHYLIMLIRERTWWWFRCCSKSSWNVAPKHLGTWTKSNHMCARSVLQLLGLFRDHWELSFHTIQVITLDTLHELLLSLPLHTQAARLTWWLPQN